MKLNDIQILRMLDQARTHIEEEKYLHAIQLYRRLLDQEPEFLEGYFELAALFSERGELLAALSLLKKAQTFFPDHPELALAVGDLYFQLRELDAALTAYRQLLGKKLPQVHYKIGLVYIAKENYPLAEEQFRLTVKLDPAFPKIYEALGEVLLWKECYTEAIDYLQRGVDYNPYGARVHLLLGEAYSKLMQWDRAHDEFVVATDMDPSDSSHWRKCGESLLHLHRYQEAEAYLRKSLEIVPRSPEALIDLAEVLAMKGEDRNARQCFEQASHIDPGNPRVQETRWRLFHEYPSRANLK